ncbi:MAG: GntR family transcriptional regulator [Proteobacteria bacterium]|nr:GntR family transcriptional regulator [Pseudomonadota bacterium]
MKKLLINKDITIRRKVYSHIREMILSGIMAPNERLIEAKIAEEIGTSRTPVREALHSLELERLITSIPSVGYMVKPISEEDVSQICEIRALLEGLAARWAIQKAHKKLTKELSKNIAAAEIEVEKGNVKAFVELDGQFHEIISKHSGSERLLELTQTLRRHMLRYRAQSIFLKDVVLRAIDGHKGILEAIEAGDIQKVNEAITYHLEQSKKDTLRYAFEKSNADGTSAMSSEKGQADNG